MPKMFGMKFPLPELRKKVTNTSGSSVIAAASTNYLAATNQAGEAVGGVTASEALGNYNYLVTRTGVIRNLVARCNAAPGVGRTFTYTVRVNALPTALTCIISGNVAVTASDLVNSAVVVLGDRITVEVVTSAGASATYHATSIEQDIPSTRSSHEKVTFGSSSFTINPNLTEFLYSIHQHSSTGSYIASEVYPPVNHIVPRKGTLKNLVAYASVAPGLGESFSYNIRVNGVPTLLSVVVSGAVAVTGTDTTDVVLVNPGDTITTRLVTSLNAAVGTHKVSFDFEEGDYRAG